MAQQGISNIVLSVVEIYREMDGRVWNKTTQLWEPATPATLAAADTAVNQTIGAVLNTINFPLALGSLGNITRAEMDTAVSAIQAALKAYATLTTKV